MRVLLIVLCCILVLITLLLLLYVGLLAEYSSDEVLVQILAGPVHLTLIPRKKKKEKGKGKEKKEKKEKKESEKKKKKGRSLNDLLELLRILLDALGNLCQRIRINHLRVHYTIAGQPNPAKAALACRHLQVSGGAVCELLEKHIRVLERDVSVEVDFSSEKAIVYASAACSIRVWQLLVVALRLLWRYWKWKRQQKNTSNEGHKTLKKQKKNAVQEGQKNEQKTSR